MLHKHRIVPGHMGGKYESGNIILLTIEEHAEAHKRLFEKFGKWQDKLAWKALSGQISKDEIIIEAVKKANTGRKHTIEHRQKIDESKKKRKYKHSKETREKIGRPRTDEHKQILRENQLGKNNNFYGKTHTDEVKKLISKAQKGNPKSKEQRERMAASAKLAWIKRKEKSDF